MIGSIKGLFLTLLLSIAALSLIRDARAQQSDDGWTKINTNSFLDVVPPDGLAPGLRGAEGPIGVLTNWNGAAWDENNKDLYFHGGGHGAYFGNEVYRFSIPDKTWERLNDPSRIVPYEQAVSQNLFTPRNGYATPPLPQPGKEFLVSFGPASTHTYDGTWFQDGKLWLAAASTFQAGYRNYASSATGLFTFDPATAKWNRISDFVTDSGDSFSLTYARSARLSDGRIKLSGGGGADVTYDPASNSFSNLRNTDWRSASITNFHNVDGTIYGISYGGALIAFPEEQTANQATSTPVPFGLSYTAGIARRGDELVFWQGDKETPGAVFTYDIVEQKWWKRPVPAGQAAPASGRPLSAWTYDATADLFYTPDLAGNIWSYRLTDTREEVAFVSPLTIEQAVAAHSAGDGTASVPKGIYRASGLISQPLDIDFNDSQLIGKTLGKGSLVVRPSGGKVTLRNFRAQGGQGAVRDESEGELWIIGARADRTLEGLLLTGNGGTGEYHIVDSTVTSGQAFNDTNRGSRHNVYIGVSKSATFDNFTSLGHVYYGHLLKSRSTDLTIRNSMLDGLDTLHSRAIDWNPEGNGTLVIDNTRITVSANADNLDFIGICRELSCRDKVTDLTVTIRDSIFVCQKAAPCIFSVGAGVNVAWDIDQATRNASRNVLWIDNGVLSSNLILDGVVVFETSNNRLKEKVTASGDLTVGRNAIIDLFFDRLPNSINLDSFFDVAGALTYDPLFGSANIKVFVDEPSMAGNPLTIFFQGNGAPRTATVTAKGPALPPPFQSVAAPNTAAIFTLALVGLGVMRRGAFCRRRF